MPATSSASPTRPRGCIDSDAASVAGLSTSRRVIPERTSPGASALMRMPRAAYVAAAAMTRPSIPPLAAEMASWLTRPIRVAAEEKKRAPPSAGVAPTRTKARRAKKAEVRLVVDDLPERLVADRVSGSEQRRADSVHQGCGGPRRDTTSDKAESSDAEEVRRPAAGARWVPAWRQARMTRSMSLAMSATRQPSSTSRSRRGRTDGTGRADHDGHAGEVVGWSRRSFVHVGSVPGRLVRDDDGDADGGQRIEGHAADALCHRGATDRSRAARAASHRTGPRRRRARRNRHASGTRRQPRRRVQTRP